MDPIDKQEIESTFEALLARILKNQADGIAMASFFSSYLERCGIRSETQGSLLKELMEFQRQDLHRCLATLADHQPGVASALKALLDPFE